MFKLCPIPRTQAWKCCLHSSIASSTTICCTPEQMHSDAAAVGLSKISSHSKWSLPILSLQILSRICYLQMLKVMQIFKNKTWFSLQRPISVISICWSFENVTGVRFSELGLQCIILSFSCCSIIFHYSYEKSLALLPGQQSYDDDNNDARTLQYDVSCHEPNVACGQYILPEYSRPLIFCTSA